MKFTKNALLQLRKLLPQPGETLPQKLDRLAEIQRQETVLAKPYREQIAALEAKMAEEGTDSITESHTPTEDSHGE